MAQGIVDGIEQVGAHHAHLVNHNQVKAAYQFQPFFPVMVVVFGFLAECFVREVGQKREQKKRMDGHPLGIDCGYACRGQHHHAFGRVGTQLSQECGLACTGFSGQVEVPSCRFNQLTGQVAFSVLFHSVVIGKSYSRVKVRKLAGIAIPSLWKVRFFVRRGGILPWIC